LSRRKPHANGLIDIDTVKTITGLRLPPATAAMKYTARIETEAFMRLGFYTLVKLLKKFLKKPIGGKKEEAIFALKDGVMRIKRETEKSIVSHFKDYKENIKFQYIFKLVETVATKLHETLLDKFSMSVMDFSNLIELINYNQTDKERTAAAISGVETALQGISKRVEDFREKLDSVI